MIERRFHCLRRPVEIFHFTRKGKFRQFHILVSGRGNLRQRSIKILVHRLAHRVKLHANPALLDLVLPCGPTRASREKSRGGYGRRSLQESSAIDGKSHDGIPPGKVSKWEVEFESIIRTTRPGGSKKRCRKTVWQTLPVPAPADCYGFTTCKLLSTEKTVATPLARSAARFLSASLSTTPSSVTCPFFTIMRIGFCGTIAYFVNAGYP